MSSVLDRVHLVAAHQAPDVVGVPAGTVRRWASAKVGPGQLPVLGARGLDDRGRPLYSKADLEALRDRPRRAAQLQSVDTAAVEANTTADGRRVSTSRPSTSQ